MQTDNNKQKLSYYYSLSLLSNWRKMFKKIIEKEREGKGEPGYLWLPYNEIKINK